jgi:hypothetical protein
MRSTGLIRHLAGPRARRLAVSELGAAACLALMLAAGCASQPVGHAASRAVGQTRADARGTVTGRLVMEGGPLGPGGQQPDSHPIPGLIAFTRAGHRVLTVRAGRSGLFSARLLAGTYRIAGRSPRLTEVSNGKTRITPCSHPASVTVTARHATRITLACVVP